MQLVGVPAYFPPVWQRAHSTPRCAPVRGKRVRLWFTDDAGLQAAVTWQVWQVVGNPAPT
jgi:hypothetical protein